MEKRSIKTVSYVHIGDKQVNTGKLDGVQRRELGTWLKITYLNHMFQGSAVFQKKEEGACGHQGGEENQHFA